MHMATVSPLLNHWFNSGSAVSMGAVSKTIGPYRPRKSGTTRGKSVSRTPGQMMWSSLVRVISMTGKPPGRPWALRYLLNSEISGDMASFHVRMKAAMMFFGRSLHETGNDIPVPNLIETTKGLSRSLTSRLEERTLGSTKTLSTTAGALSLYPLECSGCLSRTSGSRSSMRRTQRSRGRR